MHDQVGVGAVGVGLQEVEVPVGRADERPGPLDDRGQEVARIEPLEERERRLVERHDVGIAIALRAPGGLREVERRVGGRDQVVVGAAIVRVDGDSDRTLTGVSSRAVTARTASRIRAAASAAPARSVPATSRANSSPP